MSESRIRVLVTAVGGDLGQALVKSLHVGQRNFEISGCDLDASGVGQAFVARFHTVPAASDAASYVRAIDDLCRLHEIEAIIPASEAEITVLAQVGQRLDSGAVVVCQPWPWLRVFGDKLACMRALEKHLRLAAFADSSDKQSVTELVQKVGFPLMIKARHSSGSRGVVTVRTPDELATSIAETPPSVVQEFIDDQEGEFSVGVFATDTFTEVLAFRRELRHGGCSWFAETSQDKTVIDYALEFAKASGLRGSANIQLRKSARGVRLLEVNPRFSSLVAARALCGFRDAEWSILATLGRPVPARPQLYATMRFRRFFHEVVDFGSGYHAVTNWSPNSVKLEREEATSKGQSGPRVGTEANQMKIGKRLVGPGWPVYVLAELSANHNLDYDRAVRIIHAAKDAGADAIKLQTYTPDTITIASDRHEFRVAGGTLWDGRSLHDLYAEACTPWEWQPRLKKVAEELGMDLFSSAFDPTAVDFLEEMGVPAHKVASFELVDIPLIQRMARTGKPLIMSTGMATAEEIEEALQSARDAGATQIALLKCTSAYPAPAEEMNLRTIPEMVQRFGVPVGLSDHTMGIAAPVAAVALGACIIEKHLTLSRSTPGPDSAFSLEPQEFKAMVDAVRTAEKALGKVQFGLSAKEEASRVFRRSLFVVEDVKQGEIFTASNVRSIRPGHGLHTRHLAEVLGKRAAREIKRGTPMNWEFVIRS